MKLWKRSILLFVGIAVLLLSSITVSAESDSTGDVWHYYALSETNWDWEAHTGSKPNIDITSVSHTITSSEATLTMTVAGTIENSDKIIYYIIMTAGGSSYMAYYADGESYCIVSGGLLSQLENPVSDNTFTATFEIDDPGTTYTVHGYTIEYKDVGGLGEMWQDYAPNTFAPWYTGGDDNGDDGNGDNGSGGGTPGFETLVVIAALGIALIILRRRK